MSLATALSFFWRMRSLESLERLESQHHPVMALSVEYWTGVLQMVQCAADTSGDGRSAWK